MTSPRIAPGNFRQLGPFNWVFARVAARTVGVPDAHIFSTLGRSKGLFRGWLHYSARMMPFGKLSRFETELIIIRVAHLRGCDYELDHHRRLGAKAGIDRGTFDLILAGPDEVWGDRERALLTGADELIETRDLSDGTWAALARHLSEPQLISYVMLIGQYDSLATTIGALRIQRDAF